ncbi:MAG: DUF1573 domain-containing protein [Bacteroidetes bacterium]|nr:DUF1573 domain-containing protein [Bacteroidota bacterium]
MKKISVILVLVFGVVFCHAQAPSQAAAAAKPDMLQLKETTHNFGKIAQGRPVTYNFEVINTGTEPLVLENVRASCGCTTPEWSKEPIAPGATSVIKVGYNAYAEGMFNKTVTITYNNSQIKTLTISGEVYKSPVTSAPENSSVQLLKQSNQ